MEVLLDPNIWVGLLTLVVLEIVLGIDNLIFIAILADKLPPHQREKARIVGLTLAMVMRLGLLSVISWMVTLTQPLFSIAALSFSGRDLILLIGGLGFLTLAPWVAVAVVVLLLVVVTGAVVLLNQGSSTPTAPPAPPAAGGPSQTAPVQTAPSVPPGQKCTINIRQLPGGQVMEAKVAPGCPYDEAGQRSIEAAVLSAQPLPDRGFESVFQRNLTFVFTAQDQ